MDLEKYARIKQFAEEKKTETDQALGALKQLKKQLKEFGCQDVAEAEKQLRQIAKEGAKEEALYEAEVQKLIEEFPELDEE